MHILVHCKKEVFLSLCISKSIEKVPLLVSTRLRRERRPPVGTIALPAGRRQVGVGQGLHFDWINRKYGKFLLNDVEILYKNNTLEK
jgi:hypothetical protein